MGMKGNYHNEEYLQFANERIYPGDEVLIYLNNKTFLSGIVSGVSTGEIVIPGLYVIKLREVHQILKKVDGKWVFMKEEKE